VAVRAASWIWAYYFFRDSEAFSDKLKIKMFKSRCFHARHIEENLEYNGLYSGNHYFSNGIGLLYIGLFMKPFKESKQWKDKGIEIVLDSMKNQILDDGVDFEKSTAYHRLVSDFAIHTHILCKKNKIPLPAWFGKKLIKMLEFIAHYTKPDGTASMIGDADDGRLVILEENKDINDHRHHLSTGAVLFKNRLFKKQAGKFHEESLWLLGAECKRQFRKQKPIEPKSMGFHEGGFFISRDKNNYLFADCGGLGLQGLGGHGHNDTLSFELFAGDKTFITDSGTYTYSRDCVQRARFRKTAAHNTIELDGQEIAPFSEKELWHIKDITNAKLTCWSPKKDSDVFAGQHEGYKRLGNILVKRKITAEKKKGVWHIEDEITGNGTHDVALYFHFAPMRMALRKNKLITKARGTNISIEIESPKDAKLKLIKDFISYSYGRKTESKTLKVTKKCVLPAKFRTTIKVCA
ncbi:MAG: alginate lyase family protein, partial [Candidatus Aenigmarchaeota archaeon]|nr:alginate lyase family protein [Candidatus Aenigmarchaeota archaeon]